MAVLILNERLALPRFFYVAFFLSGGCALVYQAAWARIMSISLGSTTHAVSLILAAFMAGLAIGGNVFGRLADRRDATPAMFGMLELAVGAYALIYAFAAPHLHGLFAELLSRGGTFAAAAWLLAFVLIGAPATLMGGTLPILAKLAGRIEAAAGSQVASLYAVNTFGAVAGCLATVFVLIPTVGVRNTILLAAAANVTVGLIALRGGWLHGVVLPSTNAATTTQARAPVKPLIGVAVFYSGCATLAIEVLWTRELASLLTGNVVIFGVILAALLTGFGLAAAFVACCHADWAAPRYALPLCLAACSVCAALSATAAYPAARLFEAIHRLPSVGGESWKTLLCLAALYAVITVPAFVLGLVYPFALRWSARSADSIGVDVGRLAAVNMTGAIAGSLASGFVLLPWLGVSGSLLVFAFGYALLAMIALPPARWRLGGQGAVACCLLLLLAPGLRQPAFWLNHGFTGVSRVSRDDTLYYREGAESTVGVARHGDILLLAVNGLVVAETSRQDLWDLLLKAHLPMLLHDEPQKVALVGLGAGVSLGAVEAYNSVEQIDCVEISPEVEAAHRYFAIYNDHCWEDPRLRLHIDDGRRFLQTTPARYDVISVDPIDPPVCNLYTQEFYALCRDRLRDGGLMSQWLPLFRLSPDQLRSVMRAFVNVFPESTLWYDGTSVLLIGRRGGPLEIDVARFVQRAEQPRVRASLRKIDAPGPWLLLATYMLGPRELEQFIGDLPPHTDDYPLLEYVALYAARSDAASRAASLELLARHSREALPLADTMNADEEAVAKLAAARQIMGDLLSARIQSLQGDEQRSLETLRSTVRKHGLQKHDFQRIDPLLEHHVDWSEIRPAAQ